VTGPGAGTVGVLGATGAVGAAAAAQLHRYGHRGLRLGARSTGALGAVAAGLPGAVAVPVDLADPGALAAFCAGCAVVLNCAGPAYRVGTVVARTAFAAGAHYVDAAGDDALCAGVDAVRPAGRTAVVSAGMMPGLTGLLPRYLATTLAAPAVAMLGWIGGRDVFTATAAADYLRAGEGFGEPLAVWRDGRRLRGAELPGPASQLPFFPEPATALAYLSTETEAVARLLGLARARWYSVFAGEHVAAAIRPPSTVDSTASTVDDDGSTVDGRVRRLVRAAALDCFGRDRYQLVVVELSPAPTGADPDGTRTLVLRGTGASELTGTVAALAAAQVAAGAVPPGAYHAADCLDPRQAVPLLEAAPAVTGLTVLDGSAWTAGVLVEEAL